MLLTLTQKNLKIIFERWLHSKQKISADMHFGCYYSVQLILLSYTLSSCCSLFEPGLSFLSSVSWHQKSSFPALATISAKCCDCRG